MTNTNEHSLLTPDEARLVLRIGRSAMYEALRENKIPHLRFGKQYRISRRVLLELIEKGSFD